MGEFRKTVAVIRFSALGDVAIAVPLVREYACANPDVRFVVVSQEFLEPLFAECPSNVVFAGVNLKNRHRGFFGICRMVSVLAKYSPDTVADIHGNIRTGIMRFLMPSVKFVRIDKERKERKRLVEGHDLTLPLKTSMRKYEEVFVKCGLEDLHFSVTEPYAGRKPHDGPSRSVGFAPFAKHPGKSWPLEYMEKAVSILSSSHPEWNIVLFGGGRREAEILSAWEKRYSNVMSLAGKVKLGEELKTIAGLDLMVCMDSANMHFASLFGVPVISVWGATHPYAGFYGWRQNPSNALQLEMDCRPCSIYGNLECRKGGYPCLYGITPEMLISKIENYFNED